MHEEICLALAAPAAREEVRLALAAPAFAAPAAHEGAVREEVRLALAAPAAHEEVCLALATLDGSTGPKGHNCCRI